MPEGDVIRVAVHRLTQAFAGAELILTDFRVPKYATTRLAGSRTTEVVPYGKHMLHRLDSGWTIHSHFRMDGLWIVEPTAGLPARRLRNPRLRCVLATRANTALGIDLGMLDVLRTEDEEREVTGRLGPDVMADDFDPHAAAARLDDPRPVGELLLDQTVVCGIGTIYASESLRAERVQPWTPGSELPAATRAAVLATAGRQMKRTVADVLARGWRSVTDKRTEFPGGNAWGLVHGRSGTPCRECGTLVRVSGIGPGVYERAMFYCPTCQGGLAPHDPGGPIGPLGAGHGRGWN